MFITLKINTDRIIGEASTNAALMEELAEPESLEATSIDHLSALLAQTGIASSQMIGQRTTMYELVQDGWNIGWSFGTDQYTSVVTIMLDCDSTETATQMLITQDMASEATTQLATAMHLIGNPELVQQVDCSLSTEAFDN